ncbi:periodic tryptophan protein 1 homolog [Thrips palmi]|uniref:Periodic tryptophan protein 1 homolog n=1 Tax=Thrips palmi TaxID=161013 RepID=A0A6P8YBB6_THRPL|nr:periodic tryptophan protein 1 homolog [Thrips palmi]
MEEGEPDERLNFIPCLTWVRRGVAKAEPEKVKLSEDELAEILKGSNSGALESDEDGSDESGASDAESSSQSQTKEVKSEKKNDSDTEDKYGFDKYDDEEPDIVGGIAGLTVFSSNKEDPYITLPDDEDEDSEKGDDLINPNDNLILVGHVVGDQAVLEVYVQNEDEGSLYVHHDLLLPDIPLCLEWLSYDPSSPTDSNLCAIGGMTPVIHVMDLDIVDCLEPAYVLGTSDYESKDPVAVHFSKKKRKSKKKRDHIGHKDAVLDLSWNTNFTHVLASGSVDQTVILWDLETGSVNTTIDAFCEKVQTLKWHPYEGQTLLAGSCDKVVRVFDCRGKDTYKEWSMPGEVERVIWNHYNPFCFFASTDNGSVHYVDCRNDKPIWELAAHSKEVTGLSLSSKCPGLLFTGSSDGLVKVWDIEDESKPQHVWETEVKLGSLQCLESSPDSPFTIAAGGDKKSRNFGVWDLSDKSAVCNRFSKRPLLLPVVSNEDPTDEKSLKGPTSVMDTVATALDDLCLSLNTDSKEKVKKLPDHMKAIKKNKNKKKKKKVAAPQ